MVNINIKNYRCLQVKKKTLIKHSISLFHSILHLKLVYTFRFAGKFTTYYIFFLSISCCSLVSKSVQLFCDRKDCNLPGSSVHGIYQARILEWVAISFSRGSSQTSGLFTTESSEKPYLYLSIFNLSMPQYISLLVNINRRNRSKKAVLRCVNIK